MGLLLCGMGFARWSRTPRGAVAGGHTPVISGSLPPGNPSKEYIYAGSRLIAIEESGGGSLIAPSGLDAFGGSGAEVRIEWSATPGANHYQVERSDNFPGAFAVVSSHVDSNSFTDSPTDQGRAYLYRVRAADAAGNISPPSNVDLATAIAFTNDPLQRQTATTIGTTIKAEHLRELRQAVNAVRALVGLPPAPWKYPDPESNKRRNIYLEDVLELRSNLDAALSKLGMQHPYATDPTLSGGPVKASHFQEIRDRVK